jgi:predicted ATPase/DNA-binding SARP family transcriptional activator
MVVRKAHVRRNFPALEIQLFGVPQLLLSGQIVDSLRRKNRALLYYLAAQGGKLTREKLLSFLWPDHERSSTQPILRTMIHDLRKSLGEAIEVDDQNIALAPDTSIDVQIFSTALQSPLVDIQKIAEALSLYKGDFLDGFSLSDSPQFDDWVNFERERYRLMAMHGFADLSHGQEANHNYSTALASARRALAFNPFQEDVQRDVMRLLYLNGDRAGVIQEYEALRKLMDEELGVPPMPETRALYDSIINDTFTAPLTESPSQFSTINISVEKPLLPFLGRDAELETLKGQLRVGKLILLEGDPGIGKTRLAFELIASETRRKTFALVLQGTAYELEQGLPYQPVVDAIRKWLAQPEGKALFAQLDVEPVWRAEIARLLPELLTQFADIPTPTQPADESRLWEALLQFFRVLSLHQQVWLFLDDLHWADAATVAWLGYLVRHIPSSSSLKILAASRPPDGQTNLMKLLQALKREDRLAQMHLSVLSESVMQRMAATLSEDHNEQFSQWLIQNAEGNPFFITELVRYAYGTGLLKEDGTLDLELFHSTLTIPPTIQNLIESRLLHLRENARRILHIAAILGREFDVELVRQVSAFSETETLDAIEELQTAHLISPLRTDKLSFDHSLTMEVALDDMSEARRRSLHRHVAEALERIYQNDPGLVSGVIARHFMDGNAPDQAKAYWFRAGQFAANLAAWVEALAFYKQALDLERTAMKRAQIFLAMGAAHFHKGDFALAAEDHRSAMEWARSSQSLPLLEEAYLGLSLSLYPQTRFTEAIDVAKQLREFGPPELALCAEFIWGASLGVESAHPVEAEYHLREAERILHDQQRNFDSQVTTVQIGYSLASVFGQQGRSREAVEEFLKVLDMTKRGEGTLDTLRNIMLYNNLAYQLHLLGDASAATYIEKGIQLAQERGSLSHLPYLYSTSGEIALAAKDLDTAEKYFRDGLKLAEQIPLPERIAGITANVGLVAKARGEMDLAREQLQKALTLVEPLGNHHLEVRIRIWLAPLLAAQDARTCLKSARVLAQRDGLYGLLDEIEQLGKKLV